MKDEIYRGLLRLFMVLIGIAGWSCSKSQDEPVSEPVSQNEPTENSDEVVILTWEEYFSPDVIEAFEHETGVKVRFSYFENLGEMKGLITSQPDGYDLIIADGSTLADLIDLKMLRQIDRSRVGNLKNMDAKYLNLEFDRGNIFTVPYMWGTTVIAYRSDLIPEPAHSWNALWDKRHKGKVLMLDDPYDSFAVSLLSLGYEINSTDPDESEEASQHLINQVSELGAEFVDVIEIRRRLLSGDSWIAVAYNSDAAMLAEEDESIQFFVPKEGATLWLDSFAMPREAPNPDNAHLFLNFISRADMAAESSNYLWCATPNTKAVPFLDPEVLAEKAVYPDEEILKKSDFLLQPDAQRNRIVNRSMKMVYDIIRDRENPDRPQFVENPDADASGDE